MSLKQNEEYGWDAALGTIIVLTIFLFVALSAIAGWGWLRKFLESSAPNWMQAIGSLFGIFIAIWIPTKLQKDEKRERIIREWHDISVQLTAVNAMTGALVGVTGTIRNQLRNPSSKVSIEWLRKYCEHLHVFPLPSDEQITRLGSVNPKMGAELAQGKVAYITALNMIYNITKKDPLNDAHFIDLLIVIHPFLEDANTSFEKALDSSTAFAEMIPKEVL